MKKNVRIRLKDEGYDIYTPREGQTWGYRYGPTIMTYGDKVADAWFASPGDARTEADWFTYRHTEDGGKTWTEEYVVLAPTANSMDFFSVCDPAVIRFGGYYYIGYTSTVFPEKGGVCNNAFVARSKSPTGPFEKWTSEGWGEQRETKDGTLSWMGSPAPIIYFDEDKNEWGAGELSFTVVGKTLYIYYTWTGRDKYGKAYSETRVATADAEDEDWPLTVKDEGVAAERLSGQDSFDVVYCEEYEKFIAISTYKRFSPESELMFFESDDGLRFERVCDLKVGVGTACHNSGISGDELHHIKKGDLLLLGYAYGPKWGFWGTRFHEFTFEELDGVYSEEELENVKREVVPSPPCTDRKIYLTSQPQFYRIKKGQSFTPAFAAFDSAYKRYPVEGKDAEYGNFDPEIVELRDGEFTGLNVGYTYVSASYEGRITEFLIYVYPEEFPLGEEKGEAVSMEPALDCYTVDQRKAKQIRCIVGYDNGTWGEDFGVDMGFSYSGYDTELIDVNSRGIVTAKGKTGDTEVVIRLGELEATVTVCVIE